MRSDSVILHVAFAVAALTQWIYADPLTCQKTFKWESEGGESSNWFDDDNWVPSGQPESGHNVCIKDGPPDGYVIIHVFAGAGAAHAKAIWVDEGLLLEMYGDETLTLHGVNGTSTIDGTLKLCPPFNATIAGRVILNANHTITSSGSSGARKIQLVHSTASIEAASAGPVLTIGSGITIEGTGDIKLPIINNGLIRPSNIVGYDPVIYNLDREIEFHDTVTLNGTLLIEGQTQVIGEQSYDR